MPTIIEPLRADWDAVKAAAFALADKDDEKSARDEVRKFHRQLCEIRVLDPACGSGNFLYVSMEQMKRLEGEVLDVLTELGETQARLSLAGETVDPHQFLGIEINPWAAAVAELVLWIGYLQWHFKTFGEATPDQPVLKDFHNIGCRDALLVLEGEHPRIGDDGQPVTRWDGETMKRHPVTGEMVPDAAARVTVMNYESAKASHWPAADFIVGNPPFIGASRMREALGDGYVETLWATYPKMPQSADFVMFWWENAAKLAKLYDAGARKGLRCFGFITTNSLRQTFNRRVLQPHLDDRKRPVSLLFAIPDHPWVDSLDGAAVRIAMTVAGAGRREGRLLILASETKTGPEVDGREVTFSERRGRIFANLQAGVDVAKAEELRANERLSSPGVKLHGSGFIVTPEQAHTLGLGTVEGLEKHIRPYRNGRDLLQTSRGVMVIDLFGLDEEQAQARFSRAMAHVRDTVKPERDQNNRATYRENWWVFGEPRKDLRPALEGMKRYIVTVETSKHCIFQFLDAEVLPDNKLIVLALGDGEHLATLSSRHHNIWALAAGGWLGKGNDPVYVKSKCFDPFPFPNWSPTVASRLRELGERLDAHRKARQAEHPKLTITQIYNVLERLRDIETSNSGEILEKRDREIYEQGQIGFLKDLHDQIDVATAEAYGWPVDLSDEEILERLVALNRERHLEEIGGKVRWLRPEYQNPSGEAATAHTGELSVDQGQVASGKHPWPKDLPQQMAMVRSILVDLATASIEEVRSQIKRGQTKTIRERLDTLTALGQAERVGEDRYAA
ncbi:MAG: DNA methyltransferase [Pseudomonadota bacterium]